MSYKLEQPYTDIEKADFIVEYNHKKNLKIVEIIIQFLHLKQMK